MNIDSPRQRLLQEQQQERVARSTDAIERATPDWVRVCRAKNHRVVMLNAIRQPDGSYTFDWMCTCCGKDRT